MPEDDWIMQKVPLSQNGRLDEIHGRYVEI